MTTLDASPASTDRDATSGGPEAIVGRMVTILNDGATCLLLGIGHELGLLDTLAALPPATSQQVADAAGLDERYVREWLAGVVVAGFVHYDANARTYSLDADHAPFLAGQGPANLTRTIRLIALLAQAQPKVAEAFKDGGGLSYGDYPGFHEIRGEDTAAITDAALIAAVLPLTGLTERLQDGLQVADIGCGQGHAINLMARAYPNSRFLGLDSSVEAIATARAEAADWRLDNARFEVCDVAVPVGEPASYDLITAFDVIHDQAHPATVLANVREALKSDGTFLMVDIKSSSRLEENRTVPWAAFIYAISTFHCMPVSLGQGGDGLGTAWGVQTAERMVREAGFSDVVVHDLEPDPFNAYFVARP